jgi:hypothetical protein
MPTGILCCWLLFAPDAPVSFARADQIIPRPLLPRATQLLRPQKLLASLTVVLLLRHPQSCSSCHCCHFFYYHSSCPFPLTLLLSVHAKADPSLGQCQLGATCFPTTALLPLLLGQLPPCHFSCHYCLFSFIFLLPAQDHLRESLFWRLHIAT